MPSERLAVANDVLSIVQRFAGAPLEQATQADVAEQAVRDLAPRAESSTIDGHVLLSVLNHLADDYLRILRGQQADAFEPTSTCQ
jgi:hypothetical protein